MNLPASALRATVRHGLRLAVLAGALSAGLAHAGAAKSFQGLSVEVIGTGRPVLMIPGLNSGADTWRETCAALQPKVQCHLVTLPGFAGNPAVQADAFLPAMRDRLLAYVDAAHLQSPAVVGHSLGGMLALQMAVQAPGKVGPLVIVDSLPFFSAAMNPAVTVEQVRPMAEGMRAQMRAQDDAAFHANADRAIAGMAHDPARTSTIRAWGRASDRGTTTQAMYELMTTDLRPQLSSVTSPTLVLGAWAAYKPMGSTLESTKKIFTDQYAALSGVRVEMSDAGYHFLMWDDPAFVQSNIRDFLAAHP